MTSYENRNAIIRFRRMQGERLEAIGEDYGISRQRVYQITSDIPDIQGIRSKLDDRINLAIRADRRRATTVRRWWNRVRTAPPDQCWEWTGGRHPISGYGVFNGKYVFGEDRYTHRQSFYLHNARWPDEGKWVLHKCHNPPCVNPRHLYEGAPSESTADAIKENGNWLRSNLRGGDAPRAKLNVRDVRRVKLLRGILFAWEIADHLPVTEHAIYSIWSGASWSHVKV